MASRDRLAEGWRLGATAALLSVGLAAPAAEDEYREHGAHEHGHGSLEVVVDGEELVIGLRIPAVNVVGFEYEPSSDEQRQAVKEALEVFRHAAELFVPSAAARCEIENVEVELAGLEHHEGEQHAEHGEHDKHEHQESKQEDEKEHEGGHEEETHSELHAEYHFHCEDSSKLAQLQVRVFEHLQGAEELEARVVTATLQNAVDLRPGRNTVVKLAR